MAWTCALFKARSANLDVNRAASFSASDTRCKKFRANKGFPASSSDVNEIRARSDPAPARRISGGDGPSHAPFEEWKRVCGTVVGGNSMAQKNEDDKRESGLPGGGAGRKDEVGESAVIIQSVTPERCRDIMTKDPACRVPSDSTAKAAQLMSEHDIGILPVVA